MVRGNLKTERFVIVARQAGIILVVPLTYLAEAEYRQRWPMFRRLRPISDVHNKLGVWQIFGHLKEEMLNANAAKREHALLRAIESPIDHLVLGAPGHFAGSLYRLLGDSLLPGFEVPGDHLLMTSRAAPFHQTRSGLPLGLLCPLPVLLPPVPLLRIDSKFTITVA